MRIVFLHPDLGLGGAERLIVDAAAGLADRGHDVTVFTTHYEPARCFAETRSGAFAVRVHGDWLPRAIAGRLHVFFAALRMAWLALCVAAATLITHADVLIVDQVAVAVPLLRLLCPRSRVLFYCHFPDLLLAPRGSCLRAIYRAPFNVLEEVATGLAHGVLVNSLFTRATFAKTFTLLAAGGVVPEVLYPCVAIAGSEGLSSQRGGPQRRQSVSQSSLTAPIPQSPQLLPCRILLSINRFERKKDLTLALRAFAIALQRNAKSSIAPALHLVLAGGYDVRVPENVEHFREIEALAVDLGLVGTDGFVCAHVHPVALRHVLPFFPSESQKASPYSQVLVGRSLTLVRSFSDVQKAALLTAASAVIYTPSDEHFGIVPIECMAVGRPVIACANGGPLESVVHGVTGFLCEPTPEAFAAAINHMTDEKCRVAMGGAGVAHVQQHFSRRAFAVALEKHCQTLIADGGWSQARWLSPLLWFIFACLIITLIAFIYAVTAHLH